ncbi:MAG: hypothetical protein QF681_16790 [Vicinamibacterales bacterium]|nr:hypothetical protein [Vicinamibacterales bacterium]
MSPILLRPIREQFEHNRVIRLLQARHRRRYLVGVNLGDEPEATGVRSGTGLVYPDLVLTSITGARRVHAIVEVETAESVNHLEAMAEWVHFAKVRGAFYLYVPAGTTDVARRLCEEHRVAVTEIWSYHAVGDQMRFTMTYRSKRAARSVKAATKKGKRAAKAAKRTTKTAKRTTKTAKRTTKTAKRATKTAKRTTKAAKRTTKAAKRTTKRAKPARRTTKTKTTKRTSKTKTTKRTVKTAKRGGKSAKRAAKSLRRSRKQR